MSQTPVPITGGSGTSSIAAELVAGTSFQQIEVYGAGGASVLGINPDGSLQASIVGKVTINPASVSGSVGIVGTPSISGTVLVGNAPSVYGNISGSVVGFQGGGWTVSILGGPVTLYAPSASLVSGVTSIITSTSQTSVLATAAGAQRNYVTQILVTNGSATATFVDIIDGSNVIYSGYAAASGGGYAISFPAPLRQANLATSLDMKARAQASIIVAISGFTAA